jgi:hypothetical protein
VNALFDDEGNAVEDFENQRLVALERVAAALARIDAIRSDDKSIVPSHISDPADDGSCDPLYGQWMDDADLGRN